MNLLDLSQKLEIRNGKIPIDLLRKIASSKPNEIIINDTNVGKRHIKITYKLKQKAIKLINKGEYNG